MKKANMGSVYGTILFRSCITDAVHMYAFYRLLIAGLQTRAILSCFFLFGFGE